MPKGKYERTPEMRARIAEAQRERWRQLRGGAQPARMQPAVRASTALAIDETPRMIRKPADVLAVANHWLADKKSELARAEQAVKALNTLGVPPARRRLARERVRFLKRFVGALERGYVPIPRFDSDTLDLNVEELPAEALVTMAETKGKRLFDEVRYVTGREADSRPGVHGNSRRMLTRARVPRRDPLLVGVIRTSEHRVRDEVFPHWRSHDRVIPAREEHFLIAWWRPEDTTDADLF